MGERMQLPEKLPGSRPWAFLVGAYGFVWIALEGELWRVALLSAGLLSLLLLWAAQKWLVGRAVSVGQWLTISAVVGCFFGAGMSLLTLFLMVIKTGLHNHGPEFPADEFAWVWAQLPLWTLVGLLAGLGLGMLVWMAGNSAEVSS